MNDNNYKEVLRDLLFSSLDDQPSKNEKYASELEDVQQEFVKRNKELTILLKNYLNQRDFRVKVNSIFKIILFSLFCILLLGLTITVVIIFCNIDFNNIDLNSVTGIISVAVTYIGSLLSIFRIMSKYLFPVNEEKDTIDMIKVVLNNDTKVEELLSDREFGKNKTAVADSLREYKELLDEKILTDDEYKKVKNRLLSIFDIKND